jgi:SNF2 family DNA or RNA helicase
MTDSTPFKIKLKIPAKDNGAVNVQEVITKTTTPAVKPSQDILKFNGKRSLQEMLPATYSKGFDFSYIVEVKPPCMIDYNAITDEWIVTFREQAGIHIYMETQYVLGRILGAQWDKTIHAWKFPATSAVLQEILTVLNHQKEQYEQYAKRGITYYSDQYRLYAEVGMTDIGKVMAETRRIQEERWVALQTELNTVSPTADYCLEYPLMQHQHNGIEFALSQDSALIADDMGTGKTRTALDVILYRCKQKQISRALVICPNTVKQVWVKQARMFFPNEFIPIVIKGTFEERVERLKVFYPEGGKFPLYIINYESARGHPVEMQKILDDGMLIMDECHKIKAPTSQITKTVHQLLPKFSLLLTGTPIVNKPEDAWSIFHFIRKGLVGRTFDEFYRKHVRLDSYSKRITYIGLQEFNRRVKPFYIRRLKHDVLKDLPEKIYHEHYVSIEGKNFDVYKEMALKMRATLIDMEDGVYQTEAVNVITMLLRLFQICDGFISAEAGSEAWIPDAAKVKGLQELFTDYMDLDSYKEKYRQHKSLPMPALPTNELAKVNGNGNNKDRKCVIFARFVPPLEMLYEVLKPYEPALLYGGVPLEKRELEIERFWKDPNCKVMLCQIHTGGLGVDLSNADLCIFYDYWWSPGINQQAEDRLHRKGQKNNVNIIYMLTQLPNEELTVEGLYYQRLLEKKEWIKEAIEGTEAMIPTKQELIDWLGKVL